MRSTQWLNGRLIIRPGESEENRYVLLVGHGSEWRVIGTLAGQDGMRPEYWDTPNGRPGCYMVPQSRLARLPLPINKHCDGDMEVEPNMGLEPDDEAVGWDLCECRVELAYCVACDNEICPGCDRGCTCDQSNDDEIEEMEDEDEDEGDDPEHIDDEDED